MLYIVWRSLNDIFEANIRTPLHAAFHAENIFIFYIFFIIINFPEQAAQSGEDLPEADAEVPGLEQGLLRHTRYVL